MVHVRLWIGRLGLDLAADALVPGHPGSLERIIISSRRRALPPKIGRDDDAIDIDKRVVAFREPVKNWDCPRVPSDRMQPRAPGSHIAIRNFQLSGVRQDFSC